MHDGFDNVVYVYTRTTKTAT